MCELYTTMTSSPGDAPNAARPAQMARNNAKRNRRFCPNVSFMLWSMLAGTSVDYPSFHFNLEAIVGQFNTCGQLCLSNVMVIIVGQMGKVRSGRPDSLSSSKSFIQAHMRWVRIASQGVQNNNFHALSFFND